MDLKTFELWAESNIEGFHDGQAEIDEVIAPIIRELNLKGYKTKFCCSGHPFTSLNEAFMTSEETAKGFARLVKTERCDRTDTPVRALYIVPDDYFYISFDGISSREFPVPLPDGFWWDEVMAALLIQSIYNIVDSYFIAKYSQAGLTALSIIFPLQLLMIAVATGTGTGINILVSRFDGQKNSDGKKTPSAPVCFWD